MPGLTNEEQRCSEENQTVDDSRAAQTKKARKPKLRRNTQTRIITEDLHGLTTACAQSRAFQILENKPPNVEKVNLIVGQGFHSKDGTSSLRPVLLQLLESRGYYCRVMEKNPGIIEVFPFHVTKPVLEHETKRTTAAITRTASGKIQIAI
jgi:hypothetical protein